MATSNINQAILSLYNDRVYQQLKAWYSKITIFNILGVERVEVRHSAFLSWLLDSEANHGLGEEPMKKLLRLYAASAANENDAFRNMLLTGDYTIELTDIATEKITIDPINKSKTQKRDRMDIWATMKLHDRDANEMDAVLVIENKIYSGEGKDQTVRYHKFVSDSNSQAHPIEIFLTPSEAKGPQCPSFVHITYQQLLDAVIAPLMHIEMPQETSLVIDDYIRNLGKPSLDASGKDYTILAISDRERCLLLSLYEGHKDLFHKALVAGNMDKLAKVKACTDLVTTDNEQILLADLWSSNEDMFKAILAVLKDEPADKKLLDQKLYDSIFRDSNRDTTKYNVIVNGKLIGWHLNQARTAWCIFKGYLAENPNTSLDELREKFPRILNNYTYFQYLQYLFYPAADENPLWDCGKFAGQRGHGDFYTKPEDLLPTTSGKVMCVRWWRKSDGSFQQLLEHVAKNFPWIVVEEY